MHRVAFVFAAVLPFCAAEAATSAASTGDLAISIVIAGQTKAAAQVTSAPALAAARAPARITVFREGDVLVKEIYY